jgi:hypothetical protein
MQSSIQNPAAEQAVPAGANHGPSRFRTVTGNRFPRKCACGCGLGIPRDPEIRYVVDFAASKPYPAYLREHSPDYGSYPGRSRIRGDADSVPGFVPASTLLSRETAATEGLGVATHPTEVAHSEEGSSPSPQAGRPWSSGQLVFNAGSFESARSGFADYARDGETGEQLRARVNRVILEDLEQKVLALRALHEKLRDRLSGPSYGDIVGRSKPL